MIDTNVYFGQWPTRRLAGDEPAELAARLRRCGVSQAWVGSFEALLHQDLRGVNDRLAAWCAEHGPQQLVPCGAVHPGLPGWEEDLRRCHEVHRCLAIRLHPNYHGYRLDQPAAVALLEAAAGRGLLVQIAVRMEDPRTQPRLLTAGDVEVDVLDRLMATGRVWVETAMLEGVEGVARWLTHGPADRLLFGSYFPFFVWEAASLKLQESALAEVQRQAIVESNARQLRSALGRAEC
jgi:predicted TIM-barrel fold metal-dependent hydrolase